MIKNQINYIRAKFKYILISSTTQQVLKQQR